MKKLTLAIMLALGAVCLSNSTNYAQEPNKKKKAGEATADKKYTDKVGGFAIAFPGKPMKSDTKLDTAAGKSTLFIHSVETKEGNAFLVMYNDFPVTVDEDNLDNVLDGAVKGVSSKGEIVTKKNTKFGPEKIPAREVVMDAKEGIRFRILIVMRESRLYQVMVAGPDEFADSDKAKEYVKSFEFTKITKED